MFSSRTAWLPSQLPRLLRYSAYAGTLAAVASCNVFDEQLYLTAGSGGATAAENWEATADSCPVSTDAVLTSDSREHTGTVFLNTLANDIVDIGKLTGVDGPDGVFGLSVAARERVSISADFVVPPGESAPPVDIALYLTQTCDPNTFIRRNERCPAGTGENMWWQTNEPGDFYLGFDSKAYDLAQYSPQLRLTVTFPRFGDGTIDAGESCDDGNLDDGDGCSHDGLAELQATSSNPVQEIEPNNHPTAGNVAIVAPDEIIQIIGYIGGSCDHDFYMIDVPEGYFPRVTVLGADGQDCPEGTPEFKLQFNQTLGNNGEQTKLGDAEIPTLAGTGTNHCPQFDESSFAVSALEAGRYVAEFKSWNQGQHEPFHYLMRIELIDPNGGTGGSGGGGGAGGGM